MLIVSQAFEFVQMSFYPTHKLVSTCIFSMKTFVLGILTTSKKHLEIVLFLLNMEV